MQYSIQRQLSIAIENKPERLATIAGLMAKQSINIRNLCVIDNIEQGVIRMIPSNLLGQIYGIDDEGHFTPLTIKDMLPGKQLEEIQELCAWVFRIGQAVKAYAGNDNFQQRFEPA